MHKELIQFNRKYWAKDLNRLFSRKKYINVQKLHKKILNITDFQGNKIIYDYEL